MDELFLKRMRTKGRTLGHAMKKQSDILLDRVFTQDADYKTGNLYDCYGNLLEKNVEYKFQFARVFSITKDQVEFYIQFRPHYHPEKIYKWEDGKERLGFYLDVPDDDGDIHKWLLVGRNDKNFVRYNALKCNWTLRFIHEGIIYSVLGVMRERNSYNSGVWDDHFVISVENQAQVFVPTSSISNLIDYDMRFMLSDNPIHPLVYEISKREDIMPMGVTKLTMKQTHFDIHRDNVELGICNYYDTKIEPEEPETPPIEVTARVSGKILYIGGNKRTITLKFFDKDGEETDPIIYNWAYKIDGEDVTLEELQENYEITFGETSLSIKANNDFALIGKVLEFLVQDENDNTLTSTKMEVRR